MSAISAFAQSSVTIYGRVNQGYSITELQDKAGKKTKANGLAANWTSNRFGVNVNEDLGNGQSAQAVWETNIGVLDAATSTSTVRQAYVGLKDNKLGTIQVGGIYTPEYYQGIAVPGTVTGSLGQGAGDLEVSTANILTTTASHRLGTFDSSNMINYIAPKMGAVTLSVQAGTVGSQVVSSAGATTTDTKGDFMGLSANYAQGPLNATASYSNVKKSNLAAAAKAAKCGSADCAATDVNITAFGTAAVDAANTTQKNTTLNATYDIGAVKLFGYYANRELSGTSVRKFTTTNVGATYTMGALTPFVSVSSGTVKNATADISKPSATQIGVNYALSKRTNAYLYQASYKDDMAASTASYKASQTSFGVAHQF